MDPDPDPCWSPTANSGSGSGSEKNEYGSTTLIQTQKLVILRSNNKNDDKHKRLDCRYLSFDEDDAYSDEKVETRHNVASILHQLVQVRHLHIKRDQSEKDTRQYRLDIPTVIRIRQS